MIVAATGTTIGSLPESLSGYLDSSFYDSFLIRVKSLPTAIQLLRDPQKRNETIQLSALACFMVAGVRGLFLGPLSPRICPPSGASQHLHFLALTGAIPHDIEPFWPGTFKYISGLISTSLNNDLPEVDEICLARELLNDFLHHWNSTGQPVP